MRLKRSKHASTLPAGLFRVFEGVLAVMILFAMGGFVKGLTEQGILAERYAARDLAMTLSALMITPGNMYFQWALTGSPYFTVERQGYQVKIKTNPNAPGATYPFFLLEDLRLQLRGEKTNIRHVYKEARTIRVQSHVGPPLFKQARSCSPGPRPRQWILDPGHGWDPTTQQGSFGWVEQHVITFEESDLTRALAARIQGLKPSVFGQHDRQTRSLQKDEATPLKTRQQRIATRAGAAVLSLHFHYAEQPGIIIRYVADGDRAAQSAALACNTLNAVIPELDKILGPVASSGVVPFFHEHLEQDDPQLYAVLPKDRVGLIIELRGTGKQIENAMKQPQQLASAIVGVLTFT